MDDDAGDFCTYSIIDDFSLGTIQINDGSKITVVPHNTVGQDTIQFRCTDTHGEAIDSNVITVNVVAISAVTGTTKGKGIVTVLNTQDEIVAKWIAFKRGGVIPRLIQLDNKYYVVTLQAKKSKLLRIYTIDGELVQQKRVLPRTYQLAVGHNDSTFSKITLLLAQKQAKKVTLQLYYYNFKSNRIKKFKTKHVDNKYSLAQLQFQVQPRKVIIRHGDRKIMQWQYQRKLSNN
jgi:hypothetical protein